MYKLNYELFIKELQMIKDNFIKESLITIVISSFQVDKFNVGEMIKSLLNCKKDYPYYKDYFEFTALFLTFKHLLKQGVKLEELSTCKENMMST
jgi:hypothetical protein